MKEGHGKKDYQRMKPYIIYNYLMRNSDEAHTIKIAPERKEKADVRIRVDRQRAIYHDGKRLFVIRKCLRAADCAFDALRKFAAEH